MSVVVQNLLYLDRVDFIPSPPSLSPHLHCPVCDNSDQSKRNWFSIATSVAASISADYDLPSTQVVFTIPSHTFFGTSAVCPGSGKKITLYIVMHRTGGGKVMYGIGVNPIAPNWWAA